METPEVPLASLAGSTMPSPATVWPNGVVGGGTGGGSSFSGHWMYRAWPTANSRIAPAAAGSIRWRVMANLHFSRG